MDIFEYLETIQKEIFEVDLEKIEEKYYSLCLDLAGKEQAEKIKNIDLEEFKHKIREGFIKSVDIVNKNSAKVIYYEYDMDNEWHSNFFICNEYNKLEEEEDDWACDWNEEIEGPSLISFSNIYLENGFDGTDKAIASSVYLISRTVCAFAKAIENVSCQVPVCIAFHDQDPIMRIRE